MLTAAYRASNFSNFYPFRRLRRAEESARAGQCAYLLHMYLQRKKTFLATRDGEKGTQSKTGTV
jgi:hypothetical protein